jgi:hypothetical protein
MNKFLPFSLLMAGLTLLGAWSAGTLPARASDSAWVLKRGSSYWELQSSLARYTDAGNAAKQLGFLIHGEIGLVEPATLILEAPFLTRDLAQPGQTPDHLDNNGLTDILIASRIRLLEEPFALSVQPAVHIPFGYDPSFTPVIGDHTLDLDLGLNAGYDFFPFEAYLQGGAGYRLRLAYDKSSAILNQATARGETITKPTDQIFGFVEAGFWILPQLFVSLSLNGEFALTQSNTWPESQLLLQPLLAWRLNPYADVSLQLDQALWSQNEPLMTQVVFGGHFRFGLPLDRGTGLRGSVADYARHDKTID